MNKVVAFVPLVFLFLLSCSNSDSKICVTKKTISINNIGEEIQYDGLKLVFENEHYKIYFSRYISANGDAYRDGSGIFILKLDTGVAYSNWDFLDSQINVETVNDHSNYFSSGSLKISDNCNQLFFTESIELLAWFPLFQPAQAEGIYNVELKLQLADNTNVELNTSVEVIRFN